MLAAVALLLGGRAAAATETDGGSKRVLLLVEGRQLPGMIGAIQATGQGSIEWVLAADGRASLWRWRAKPTRTRGRRRLGEALRQRLRRSQVAAVVYIYSWRRRGRWRALVAMATADSFSEVVVSGRPKGDPRARQGRLRRTVVAAIGDALSELRGAGAVAALQAPSAGGVTEDASTSAATTDSPATVTANAEGASTPLGITTVDGRAAGMPALRRVAEDERTAIAFYGRVSAGVITRKFSYIKPVSPNTRDHKIPALFNIGLSGAAFPLFGADLGLLAHIGWFGELNISLGGRSVFVGDETEVVAPTTMARWNAGLRLRQVFVYTTRLAIDLDFGVGQDTTAFSLADGDPRLQVVPDTAYTLGLAAVHIRTQLPVGLGLSASIGITPVLSGGRVADRVLAPAAVTGLRGELLVEIPLAWRRLSVVMVGGYRAFRYRLRSPENGVALASGATDSSYTVQVGVRYTPRDYD